MVTMQAVRLHSLGGSEVLVLEEMARPQAARAHEMSQTVHVRGKIVLQVGG